ncbi:MAG: riboflavin synthase [Actinobacteria bacterium]|nr:riboflavin synthase [Actinomycetota bacterium]
MFTGLVEDRGVVISIQRLAESAEIEIRTALASQIKAGDSISVNGTCLTARAISADSFIADVMVQTLRLTSLADIAVGDQVNLELALLSGSRMGGHIVQGHVDGVAVVEENSNGEKWNKVVIRIPEKLAKYIVNQGSIAVDGVSLTVGEIYGDLVTLWLIPETLAKTNLGSKVLGSKLNIEVDVLAKYIERLMKASE